MIQKEKRERGEDTKYPKGTINKSPDMPMVGGGAEV